MDIVVVAWIAALLFAALAVFQVALVLGAPFGAVVYGGRKAGPDGKLVGAWRWMSAAAAAILILFALIILARAGAIETSISSTVLTVASWFVVAYMALNTAANLMSVNKVERWVMGSITVVLVVLCAIVAAAGPA